MSTKNNRRIAILTPSKYFKGGILTFTNVVHDFLLERYKVKKISFNKQVPLFIYPAKERVKKEKKKNPVIDENDIINWYNPVSWYKAYLEITHYADTLYIPWWTILVSLPILAIIKRSKQKGIKIIVEFHNVIDHNANKIVKAITKLILKKMIKNIDKVILHSKSDKNKLKELGIEFPEITIIPHMSYNFLLKNNIVKDEAKRRLHLNTNATVILQFGIVRPYKGIEYAIKATKIVKDKNYNIILLIVGENWINKSKIMELVAELNLKDNVIWIDRYVDDDELDLFFKASDIAIFPYTSASQSGSVQIAFASGIPVIASKVGGFKDIIRDKVNGLFCEPENEYSLADAITMLIDSTDLRKKISDFAKKDFVENLSKEKLKRYYYDIIDSML